MPLTFGVWSAIRSSLALFVARPAHYLLLGAASMLLFVLAIVAPLPLAVFGATEAAVWPMLLTVPTAFALHAAMTTYSVGADLRAAPISIGVSIASGFSRFGPLLAMSAVYAFCMAVFAVPVYLMQKFDPNMQFVTQSQWLTAQLLLPFVLFMRWLLLAHTTANDALYPPAIFKRCDEICRGRYWGLFFLFLALLLLLTMPFAVVLAGLQQPHAEGVGAQLGAFFNNPSNSFLSSVILFAVMLIFGGAIQIYQNAMAYSFFALRHEKDGVGG